MNGSPGTAHSRLFYFCNFVGLRPFLPLDDFKLDSIAFLERLKSIALNS